MTYFEELADLIPPELDVEGAGPWVLALHMRQIIWATDIDFRQMQRWVRRQVEEHIRHALRAGLPWHRLVLCNRRMGNYEVYWLCMERPDGQRDPAPMGCLPAATVSGPRQLTTDGAIRYIHAAEEEGSLAMTEYADLNQEVVELLVAILARPAVNPPPPPERMMEAERRFFEHLGDIDALIKGAESEGPSDSRSHS